MAGLVILIENKSGVIEALKMKVHLKNNNVPIEGIVFLDGTPSTGVIEDMMQLQELGPFFKVPASCYLKT